MGFSHRQIFNKLSDGIGWFRFDHIYFVASLGQRHYLFP